MLNATLDLNKNLFLDNIEKRAIRDGFGEGIVEAARADERVVALCADLTESTRLEAFREEFPERFIQVGVAEQTLVTVASGMANYGKIPFAASFAAFSPGRNWEQIRTTITLNDVPVKIVGSHAGLAVGTDGATHQALEDIALMRVLPNMVVIVPADAIEAKKATIAAATNNKPTYIRLARPATPVVNSESTPFTIGRAKVLWEEKNPQVAIIACGIPVYDALVAARELSSDGVGVVVVNNHTIKPLDEQVLLHAARSAGAVVTVEDHQKAGGMGGAIAELLARHRPVPMEFVGVNDVYGESGTREELYDKYEISAKHVVTAVKKVLARKR